MRNNYRKFEYKIRVIGIIRDSIRLKNLVLGEFFDGHWIDNNGGIHTAKTPSEGSEFSATRGDSDSTLVIFTAQSKNRTVYDYALVPALVPPDTIHDAVIHLLNNKEVTNRHGATFV